MDSALKKSTLKIISAHVLDVVKRYKTDETGSTAIEYGLMSALIGVLAITGMSSLGMSVNAKFDGIADALDGPPSIPTTNAAR